MIKYCKRCCLPSTKPHLSFDEEGICNACRNYENRKSVDWDERKAELMEILDRYRSKDHSNWDCIIPVSGGKDSTYQVITMLELCMIRISFSFRLDSLWIAFATSSLISASSVFTRMILRFSRA